MCALFPIETPLLILVPAPITGFEPILEPAAIVTVGSTQASPKPSPFMSVWLGLATVGQLSLPSGTPSPSVSLGVAAVGRRTTSLKASTPKASRRKTCGGSTDTSSTTISESNVPAALRRVAYNRSPIRRRECPKYPILPESLSSAVEDRVGFVGSDISIPKTVASSPALLST